MWRHKWNLERIKHEKSIKRRMLVYKILTYLLAFFLGMTYQYYLTVK